MQTLAMVGTLSYSCTEENHPISPGKRRVFLFRSKWYSPTLLYLNAPQNTVLNGHFFKDYCLLFVLHAFNFKVIIYWQILKQIFSFKNWVGDRNIYVWAQPTYNTKTRPHITRPITIQMQISDINTWSPWTQEFFCQRFQIIDTSNYKISLHSSMKSILERREQNKIKNTFV